MDLVKKSWWGAVTRETIEHHRKREWPYVALVTNVLAHYRVPCFAKLAEQMPGQITYFLLAEHMQHRYYVLAQNRNGLPVIPLRGWRRSRSFHDDIHLNDVRPVLRRMPDVVILGGWDEPTYLALWAWAVAVRRKIVFWIESTANDTPRSGLKEAYKRILLRQAAGCIVPGRRAHQYCRRLGMPERRIFTAPNGADRSHFRGQADRLLSMRESLRRETGVNGIAVLFVGRLVEALKGVSTLIQACAQLEGRGKKVSLLLVGDGPDRKRYQELAQQLSLADARFLGMLGHEDLCRYYTMADVFVLTSRSEPWGFVLNEAMEFGLPLVVSEAVGAGPDLVRPGENGFMVPVGDASALAEVLRHLEANDALRQKMGQVSRTIIQNFSPENWANGVMKAIRSVLDH